MKILILGGGPTGLGAAWRLNELGHTNWSLLEASDCAGGLASSFRDSNGFLWDIGGHVQFSHYEYFDAVMDELISPDEWSTHQRESWVWLRERFVPYPFQNNIRFLPREDLLLCLKGLVELYKNGSCEPKNFREWILATFGAGIAEVFLLPYNFKIWAHRPEDMNYSWVGERVAVTDLTRVLENLVYEREDISWGPNNVFRYPKHGGTGAIWRACAGRLPEKQLNFASRVRSVNLSAHRVETADGRTWDYDVLINTIPILELLTLSSSNGEAAAAAVAHGLKYSSTNIVGIGLKGRVPDFLKTKCWMYFPEDNCPFYRATVFSNYSPYNVPDVANTWSLMTETSESECKPVDVTSLAQKTIEGLINTHLIKSTEEVASVWTYRAKYGYPIPGLHRDSVLDEVLPRLESNDVYSRGRFGAWKYEVSNQDHSFMQGVEIVERLLRGREEITFNDPNHANSKKHPFPFERWVTTSTGINSARTSSRPCIGSHTGSRDAVTLR